MHCISVDVRKGHRACVAAVIREHLLVTFQFYHLTRQSNSTVKASMKEKTVILFWAKTSVLDLYILRLYSKAFVSNEGLLGI